MDVKETDLLLNIRETDLDGIHTSLVEGVLITWGYYREDKAQGRLWLSDPPFPARPLCVGQEGVTIIEDAAATDRLKFQHWLEGPRDRHYSSILRGSLPGFRDHHRAYIAPRPVWAFVPDLCGYPDRDGHLPLRFTLL